MRLALALTALLLLAASPAAAQKNQRVRTGPDEIAGVPFSDVPYRVESMGLALRLPEGATISSTSTVDGVRSFVVSPANNSWLLRVLAPRVTDPALDAAGVVDSMVNEILDPTGDRATMDRMSLQTKDGRKRVFDRLDELQTTSATGARFYLGVKQSTGAELVTGYTVFRPAPGQLLVFEINCMGSEFTRVRSIYEAIIAASEIADPTELASRRAAGVTAGETLLADLDAETIASYLRDAPEWRRLYRPGPTGRWSDDTEVAYQSIEIKKGQRGDLATGRTSRSWSAAEREKGFVATVVARYLDGDQTVDILSSYFLSLDGESETWSVRMRLSDQFESLNWTETGARAKGKISVTIAQPDGEVTEKAWPVPPTGYLSHVEALLLPRILAERSVEGEFAYYRYNTQLGELTLRRDVFEGTSDGWRLTTRPHEDAPDEILELSTAGDVVTQRLSDDIRGKPLGRKEIASIWRHKGLPLD